MSAVPGFWSQLLSPSFFLSVLLESPGFTSSPPESTHHSTWMDADAVARAECGAPMSALRFAHASTDTSTSRTESGGTGKALLAFEARPGCPPTMEHSRAGRRAVMALIKSTGVPGSERAPHRGLAMTYLVLLLGARPASRASRCTVSRCSVLHLVTSPAPPGLALVRTLGPALARALASWRVSQPWP